MSDYTKTILFILLTSLYIKTTSNTVKRSCHCLDKGKMTA